MAIGYIAKAKPPWLNPALSAFPTVTVQSPREPSCLQGALLPT